MNISFDRLIPRLLCGFILLAPLPLGGLAWMHARACETTINDTTLTTLVNLADKKASQIETFLVERQRDSQLVSQAGVVLDSFQDLPPLLATTNSQSPDFHQAEARYRHELASLFPDPLYYDVLLIDSSGMIFCSLLQKANTGENLASGRYRDTRLTEAHRRALETGEIQLTEPESHLPSAERNFIFIVSPVVQDNEVLGNVALQLELESLSLVAGEVTGLGENGEIIMARRGEQNHGLTQDHTGREVVAAWRDLPMLGWGLMVRTGLDETLAPARRMRDYVIWALLTMMLLAVGATLVFRHTLIKPITQLTAATRRYAAGDFNQRVVPQGSAELVQLAESLNQMADSLTEQQATMEKRVRERTRALAESETGYKAILRTTMDGFFLVDLTGRILEVNNSYCDMVGYSSRELLNMRISDLEDSESPEQTRTHIKKIMQTGHDSFETRHRRKDGRVLDIEVSVNFLAIGGGRLVAFLRDITERKRAEAALFQAKQEAEAASRTKDEFLANMSHEIRTPMNAIIGLTKLVLKSELQPRQNELLSKAHTSAQALLKTLNEILDYSKIEAGQLEIEQVPTDIKALLHEVADLFVAGIEEKDLKLSIEIDPELPPAVITDPMRLQQVLNNLVGNAIKFTEEGEIIVRVEVADSSNDSLLLRFSVQDTGIGLSPEQVDTLFEAFTQANGSISRKYGGTGLGLCICRRLVELMDGKITAASREGEGAIFSFTLPTNKPMHPSIHHDDPGGGGDRANQDPEPKTATREKVNFNGARVLLVDDNQVNQMIAAQLLQHLGLQVTVADNAGEALAAMEKSRFEVVLMDLHMPEMDGLEATRRIRKLPDPPPVIAMTAAVSNQDLEQGRAAGTVDFVAKPIDPDELVTVLRRWLPGMTQYTTDLTEETEGSPQSGKNILPAPKQAAGENHLTPSLPGFDLTRALNRMNGNETLLMRLLTNFVIRLNETGHTIEAELAAGALPKAKEKLHGLKGEATNLGAIALASAAHELEQELTMVSGQDRQAELKKKADFMTELIRARENLLTWLATPAETGKTDEPAADVRAERLKETLVAVKSNLENHQLSPEVLREILKIAGGNEQVLAADGRRLIIRLLGELDRLERAEALATIDEILALLNFDTEQTP